VRPPRELLIVGTGGFARETAEAVRAVNEHETTWHLRGYLDDDPRLNGRVVEGIRVLGPVDAIGEYPDASVAVCTGHPGNYFSRKRIVDRLALASERYATIVHPSAAVSRSCRLGSGTVLLAHVTATAAVEVGAHVAVMPQVVLTHDDVVEDYATFGSGVRVGGRALVRQGAYIGAGALILQELIIGAWALIGMGAVVTKDVPAGQVWAGCPARFFRDVELPRELWAALDHDSPAPRIQR
jgi:sugar O-acyltransferase (sialic acid O-acetyltransferase NeuD family)